MKFKVSFTLDVTGTSYSLKNKEDAVSEVIQNLSMLFGSLTSSLIQDKIEILTSDNTEVTKRAAIAMKDDEIKLLSSMFNDFEVDGEMENGHRFKFTHKEPGYKEKTIYYLPETTK